MEPINPDEIKKTPAEGIHDSAVLLLMLGEEDVAPVLKCIGVRDVQKVGAVMTGIKSVSREKSEQILDELFAFHERTQALMLDDDKLRGMLTKAFGHDRADNMLSKILQNRDLTGIENLKWMDPTTVAELIKGEHPQIIATVLAYLEFEQAGHVLVALPERLRNDVILRIATFDRVHPTALQELNASLTKIDAAGSGLSAGSLAGVRQAAEILNFAGQLTDDIIEGVREYDPDLAQRILDNMFVFENLLDVNDRGIQVLLREVQTDTLVIALKGCTQELHDKFLRNMSARAAQMFRDDIEAKGPVRVSEVEEKQKEIIKVARQLAEDGHIVLAGKGGTDKIIT